MAVKKLKTLDELRQEDLAASEDRLARAQSHFDLALKVWYVALALFVLAWAGRIANMLGWI